MGRTTSQTLKPFRKGNCYTHKEKSNKQNGFFVWCLQNRLWVLIVEEKREKERDERKEKEGCKAKYGKSHDSH